MQDTPPRGRLYSVTTGQARMGMWLSKKEYLAHGGNDSCADRPDDGMARDHGNQPSAPPTPYESSSL
jgi:hypothetical protein